MRHLADVVIVNGTVTGNSDLVALCGATGKKLLPTGTKVDDTVCPECLALANGTAT